MAHDPLEAHDIAQERKTARIIADSRSQWDRVFTLVEQLRGELEELKNKGGELGS